MKKFTIGVLVGIAIGGIGMGIYSHNASYLAKERELAGIAFIHNVSNAEMATRVLEVLDEERYDTASQLVALQRDAGIDESYRLMASHKPEVGQFIARQLLPGLSRTEAYLAKTDVDNHLLGWSQDVKEYVQRASVEP